MRRADPSGSGGLVLLGTETAVSGTGTDDGAPAAVVSGSAAESVVFWLRTLSFTTATNYPGSSTGGTWRGAELWIQRYQ
jgi:hypothetical protein